MISSKDFKQKTGTELVKLSQEFSKKGDFENAFRFLDQAIKEDGFFISAYVEKGVLYHRQRNYEEALEWLNTALALDSDNQPAQLHREVVLNSLVQKLKNSDVSLVEDNAGTYFGITTTLYNQTQIKPQRITESDDLNLNLPEQYGLPRQRWASSYNVDLEEEKKPILHIDTSLAFK